MRQPRGASSSHVTSRCSSACARARVRVCVGAGLPGRIRQVSSCCSHVRSMQAQLPNILKHRPCTHACNAHPHVCGTDGGGAPAGQPRPPLPRGASRSFIASRHHVRTHGACKCMQPAAAADLTPAAAHAQAKVPATAPAPAHHHRHPPRTLAALPPFPPPPPRSNGTRCVSSPHGAAARPTCCPLTTPGSSWTSWWRRSGCASTRPASCRAAAAATQPRSSCCRSPTSRPGRWCRRACWRSSASSGAAGGVPRSSGACVRAGWVGWGERGGHVRGMLWVRICVHACACRRLRKPSFWSLEGVAGLGAWAWTRGPPGWGGRGESRLGERGGGGRGAGLGMEVAERARRRDVVRLGSSCKWLGTSVRACVLAGYLLLV